MFVLTFIPTEYKKKIKQEYALRFFTFFCIVLSFIFLLGSVLTLPYVILLQDQEQIITNRLSSLQSSAEAQDSKEMEGVIKMMAEDAQRIIQRENTPSLFYALTSLLSQKRVEVSLSQINVAHTEGGVIISLSGIAGSRESLRTFVSSLQNTQVFSGVSLPVSTLAREKDISFSLTFSYKPQ